MIRFALASAVAIVGFCSADAATFYGYTASPGGLVTGEAKDAHDAFISSLASTSVENLESYSAGSSFPKSLTFSGTAGDIGATISGPGTVSGSFNNLFPTSGTKQITTFGDLSLAFAIPVYAFGFYATDATDYGAALSVTFNNGSIGSYQLTSGTLPTGNLLFFGVTSDSGISSVRLLGAKNTDGFGYDDLTVGSPAAVPEPATWAMFIGGFGLIGAAMRRRRVFLKFV